MIHTLWNNIKWLVTGQLLSRLIKGVLVLFAARILGTEYFGSFNLASSVAATCMLLNDWGLDMLLIREAAKEDEKNKNYLAALFIIKTVLLLISGFVLLFLGPLIVSSLLAKHVLPIIGISVLLDTLRDFHLSLARAKNRMDIDAKNNIVVNSVVTIIGITILFIHPSIILLAYAYLLGSLTGLLLTLFDTHIYYRTLLIYLDHSVIKQVFREGIPLGLSIICITILLYADNIIIGWMLGTKAVGLYAAPMKLIQLLYVGAGLIANAYLPLLSRGSTMPTKVFHQMIHSSIRLTFLTGTSIALTFFVISPLLIPLLLGQNYAPSSPIFRILVLSVPFVYTSTILGHLLLIMNRQSAMIPFLIIGTSVNLLLNVLFIGKLGIEGAAIANVIAQIINFTGYYIVYAKYKPQL